MAEEKKYLSIPQLAKLLGLSRIAIFKRVKAGKIPAVRIGRNYAISEEFLDQIRGKTLSEERKDDIKSAVKRTVREYGEVLKRLGKE